MKNETIIEKFKISSQGQTYYQILKLYLAITQMINCIFHDIAFYINERKCVYFFFQIHLIILSNQYCASNVVHLFLMGKSMSIMFGESVTIFLQFQMKMNTIFQWGVFALPPVIPWRYHREEITAVLSVVNISKPNSRWIHIKILHVSLDMRRNTYATGARRNIWRNIN